GNSGRDYALSVRCAAEDLGLEKPVQVTLAGGNFTKCECMAAVKALEESLNPPGENPGYQISRLSIPPVAGALFWALELGGLKLGEEEREKLAKRVIEMIGI
ncbi:MAG: hypothetical protein LBT59_15670, partial [Clostridiales bacterium]|nr:hypothetical protein [Clostridiales bacterium]